MFETIHYEDTLNINKTKLYIDCRSPSEFNHSSIPHAINIPVLLDDEREIVGTLYKNGELEQAKIVGVTAISKRLPDIFTQIIELKQIMMNYISFVQEEVIEAQHL